ncbi:EcsC family protein [Aestuariimicrobium soli]|uniref:EcsC family protein n=1 Tax=Aestuariimicrobium soli TaxID=2035834 RepID=UPI003EBAC40A
MVNPSEIGKSIVGAPGKAPGVAGHALKRVLDLAIDGYQGLPGAREVAAGHLAKKGNRDDAIDSIAAQHVGLAGAQGFVTNLGGIALLAVSIPANLAGVMIVQSRMVASIAHLRGYDVDDSRVRAAVMMCLLGHESVTKLLGNGKLPGNPLTVATAPVFDPALEQQIAESVLGVLLTGVGGKKVGLLFSKRVPILGGVVGAGTDGWSTYQIARYASEQFIDRRHA